MEDSRVGRNPGEPPKQGPAGAARWAGYLDWLRAEITDAVLTLSPAEQRRSRLPSGWSPIELLSHVLHMEQRWIVWGFLGEEVDEVWGDWDIDDPWNPDADGRWQVEGDVTADELADRLREQGLRTTEVLAQHRLDEMPAPGGRFDEAPASLEGICFHVLAEYARHAGHLDIAAELTGDR